MIRLAVQVGASLVGVDDRLGDIVGRLGGARCDMRQRQG